MTISGTARPAMTAPADRSVPRRRVKAGDTTIDRRGRRRDASALLSYGFRPFFLAAGLYAALAIPLWLWMLSSGAAPAGAFTGLAWHAHEMVFGFLGAVIAGFILTAVPNWTGRLPLSGAPLAILVLLWLAGRIAVAAPSAPALALALDLAFPIALILAVWREIVAGRNLKNVPIALLLTLFTIANLADHLQHWLPALDGLGIRLALAVAAMLIALVGGRIVPSFTRNRLARRDGARLPAPFGVLDKTALAVTAAGLAAWVAAPATPVSGTLLLAAGILLAGRLARWRGLATWGEPLLLVLHVGYLWLAVSVALLGAAALFPAIVPASAAIHALTAGAIGTMTLAVMTRATRGHTGRELTADRATSAIYVLVTLGAMMRVLAPFWPDAYLALLTAGGLAWSGAFALFVLVYGPMLLTPRKSAA